MRISSNLIEPLTTLGTQIDMYKLACAQDGRIVSTWEALLEVVADNPGLYDTRNEFNDPSQLS